MDGHISAVIINVSGDGATIAQAMEIFQQAIGGAKNAGPALERPAMLAKPASPPALPEATAKTYQCKQCDFRGSKGALSGHVRAKHMSKSDDLWCPQKNCGRSFSKKAWLNAHLEKEHGISDPL